MTVKELRERLRGLRDDAMVYADGRGSVRFVASSESPNFVELKAVKS